MVELPAAGATATAGLDATLRVTRVGADAGVVFASEAAFGTSLTAFHFAADSTAGVDAPARPVNGITPRAMLRVLLP
jgi:hypothetical protein